MPYKSLLQLQSAFHSLVAAHPAQASEESIGKSYLGKDIIAYNFGSPQGGHVVWEACIHGRECLNPEILLQYATWLFSGAPEANRILSNNWTTIVPAFNIDKYLVQRKNAHFTPAPYVNGVDLNRNFLKGWGLDPNTECRVPSSYPYQGPSALSEPESVVMRNYLNAKKPDWFIDMHTGRAEIDVQSSDSVAIAVRQQFLAQDAAWASSTGVTYNPLSLYPNGRGYIVDDAYAAGCHVMLWELNPIETTDTNGPAQETVATIWFPRFLPMAQYASASVEVSPSDKVVLVIESVAHGITDPPPSSVEYATGSSVEIMAYPDDGMKLEHWLVNGNDGGKANPLSLTLNADTTVEAVFAEVPADNNSFPLLLLIGIGLGVATLYFAKKNSQRG